MKANEIRDMSVEEQQGKLIDLNQTLFNLRFQLEIGQLENPQKNGGNQARYRPD